MATLTHRYSFASGTLVDSVGGAAWTGALYGGAAVSIGQVSITGNNQYVLFPAGTIPRNATTFSIEVWATTASSSGGNGWNRLVTLWNGAIGVITISRNQGNLAIGCEINLSSSTQLMKFVSTFPFDNQNNIHIVLTVTIGDYVRIYINSVLYATSTSVVTATMVFYNKIKYVTIGDSTGQSLSFQGSVREFRIWDGALQQSDVTAIYSAGPSFIPGSI